MDDRWYAPLAETVRYFLAHKKHFDIAQRIFDNRLAASDEGDRLRGDYLKLLQTELDSLTPQQVATLVSWSLSGRMELSEPIDPAHAPAQQRAGSFEDDSYTGVFQGSAFKKVFRVSSRANVVTKSTSTVRFRSCARSSRTRKPATTTSSSRSIS
jgi:hypothetical protein